MRTLSRLLLLFCFALPVAVTSALAQDDVEGLAEGAAGLGACAACSGFFLFIFLGLIALNIALLVWVTRDARNRGTENAVLWLIVVLIAGPIGLIVYFLSRPKGNLVLCPRCQGKRLEFSAKCPHCGNA